MKRSTEKEILLAAACAAFYFGAYFLLVKPILAQIHPGSFPPFMLFVYSFCLIACLFLFHGARWARIAIGAIAFSTALILSWITVRWFVLLRQQWGTDNEVEVIGIRLGNWGFLVLLAVLAVVALGYIFFGSWILKRRA
jgi:hypothetical protein